MGDGMTRSDVRSHDYVVLTHSASKDWQVLKGAILESLRTSSDAFMTKLSEVIDRGSEFWQEELRSATWAVVQGGEQTLGIAAAKPPTDEDVYAVRGRACFIESVWIDPDSRNNGMGQRLVTYLIDQQRQVGIQEFYLWVLQCNGLAKSFYDYRMGFKETGRESEHPETQLSREFDSDVVDEEELKQHESARAGDKEKGITYRLLRG
jgi:N-acetylglutamate synthase-like GNAT family acetyltransferase